METENKYYTPTIEEFHTGFEYETFVEDKNIWSKETFYLNKSHIDLVYFVSLIGKENVPKVRVKYLDKEDIESLGFRVEQKPLGSWHEGEFDVYNKDPELMDFEFENINPADPTISIQGLTFKIKNKSEFSRLMKQLS